MNQNSLFTDFRISLSDVDKVKAFVSVKVADAFWITGLKVIEGSRGLFVAMPSKKDAKGEYQDIAFPASKEIRDLCQKAVLAKVEEIRKGASRELQAA